MLRYVFNIKGSNDSEPFVSESHGGKSSGFL